MSPGDGEGRPGERTTLENPARFDTQSKAETLDAYRSDSGQLWVWCDHEQTWHRHGGCCTCDEDPCACVGQGDGHRGEHCRCEHSPYDQVGYVLTEVGPLTDEILAAHPEASWIDGCRPGNCRIIRQRVIEDRKRPTELPPPSAPLEVARAVARSYADPTYLDQIDEEDRYLEFWSGNKHPVAPRGGGIPYDDWLHGPLILRRWRGSWMRWARSHWHDLDTEVLLAELYELLGGAWYEKVGATMAKTSHVPWNPNRRNVGEMLAALEGVTLIPSTTDAPSWLSDSTSSARYVACANGLLNIDTHELEMHEPDWFNLVAVPFDYVPDPPPPARWLKFLAELWPNDPAAVDALQEWFGYVLSGRTDLQKLLLIVGPPRSGKGTIVRILQELVGRGNYAGPTLASLGTNFGLQPLVGKPLAVVADARLGGAGSHVIVERLLSISGEDTLTIDRKYRDPWSGRLPTRVMILSNEIPHFGDASGAIATRFVTLVLETSWLGRENIDLERDLKAELPGILSWALAGLTRLTEERRFTVPASAAEAELTMMDSASPTSAFIRDRCDIGAGLTVTPAELYNAWRGWCLLNGRDHPGNQQTFSRTLRSVMPRIKMSQPRVGEVGSDGRRLQVRIYEGIALKRSEARNPLLSTQINPGITSPEVK